MSEPELALAPKSEVIVPPSGALPSTPMAMIAQAVANGASIETLNGLMALQERWEAHEAKKAYTAAMTAFKTNIPTILKNRHVEFELKSGGTTKYNHADLFAVCDAILPELSKHRLSHSWVPEVTEKGTVRVRVVITHEGGHSEEGTMEAPPDLSGGKNAVQAIASTSTYLARYTLLLRLGIATKDDDGRGGPSDLDQPISEDQRAALQKDLEDTKSDIAAFCSWMKVESLADITLKMLPVAQARIADKRKRAAQK